MFLILQIHTAQGADGTPTVHAVQTLAEVATAQSDGLAVDLNNVTEATLNQDGQLILTGEDGHGMIHWMTGRENVCV
jgi:nuclear respiratory factor 1